MGEVVQNLRTELVILILIKGNNLKINLKYKISKGCLPWHSALLVIQKIEHTKNWTQWQFFNFIYNKNVLFRDSEQTFSTNGTFDHKGTRYIKTNRNK